MLHRLTAAVILSLWLAPLLIQAGEFPDPDAYRERLPNAHAAISSAQESMAVAALHERKHKQSGAGAAGFGRLRRSADGYTSRRAAGLHNSAQRSAKIFRLNHSLLI